MISKKKKLLTITCIDGAMDVSVSNLPFHLTNGDTAQGLYRINGFDKSDNARIGSPTNLQMCLPFGNVSVPFFTTDTAYEKYYVQVLDSVLKGYSSLWESHAAWKIERTEIIAHGTSIVSEFYRNELQYTFAWLLMQS